MRKTALVLAIVLVLSIVAMPALAAETRAVSIVPSLSFQGTTATCVLRTAGNNVNELFEATIRLYRENELIAVWFQEGNGYIFFSDTKNVTAGYNYTLTVDLTVNGEVFPTASTTKYCY